MLVSITVAILVVGIVWFNSTSCGTPTPDTSVSGTTWELHDDHVDYVDDSGYRVYALLRGGVMEIRELTSRDGLIWVVDSKNHWEQYGEHVILRIDDSGNPGIDEEGYRFTYEGTLSGDCMSGTWRRRGLENEPSRATLLE